MRTYYIHDGRSEKGPYTFHELQNLELRKWTPIWFKGLPAWTTAENVPELACLLSAPLEFNAPRTHARQTGYTYHREEAHKSFFTKTSFLSITGLSVALIGWLIYNNHTQAAEMEFIQQIQMQVASSSIKIEEDKKAREAEQNRINELLTQEKKNYRNNWHKYIQVGTKRFKHSSLGGMDSLEISVVNNTEYMLDEVIARVTYIKANGKARKTFEIPIYNVAANSYKTLPVAEVERGLMVDVLTTGVVSKKMHFCYVRGSWAENKEDPYFCN